MLKLTITPIAGSEYSVVVAEGWEEIPCNGFESSNGIKIYNHQYFATTVSRVSQYDGLLFIKSSSEDALNQAVAEWNFSRKKPTGDQLVGKLCKFWQLEDKQCQRIIGIVTDFLAASEYPYINHSLQFKYAEPVTKEELEANGMIWEGESK